MGFSYDVNNDFSPAWTIVKIQKNDLLPGAEQGLAVFNRDRQGGTKERGTKVGEAIIVTPAVVVMVSLVGWNQLFDKFFQIIHEPGFILDRGHGRRRPGHEEGYEPLLKILLMYFFPYLGSDVDYIAESGRFLDKSLGVNFDHVNRFLATTETKTAKCR
jgi:hypothetical protein